ncbi:hypothetical protein ACWDZ8_08605 [Streptomyces sp. NPDC003233]
MVKKSVNARPLPPGRGRKLDWTSAADCYDENTRPHTAWLWRALAHWTAEHGDPETGFQPLNRTASGPQLRSPLVTVDGGTYGGVSSLKSTDTSLWGNSLGSAQPTAPSWIRS